MSYYERIYLEMEETQGSLSEEDRKRLLFGGWRDVAESEWPVEVAQAAVEEGK